VSEDVDVELAVVVKTRKGVIQQRERAVHARRRSHAFERCDLEHRIGRRFEHDQPSRPFGQRALDALDVLDRQHRVRDPIARQDTADHVARRLIGLGEHQHVIALLAQRKHREIRGGDAR
jgi:hypothetical protein